ncbi:MAG: phosphoribosylanthranilate isomerase [Candidatus Binataceae bacterium]
MAVKIKICGVTRPGDARLAVELGADLIGLNFYPPSPRCISLDQACAIAREIKGRALLVGVFVNAARAYIEDRRTVAGLDMLQFHGDEDDAAITGWPLPVIRTVRVNAARPAAIANSRADFILFDTWHPELFGGTGRTRPLGGLAGVDLSRVFISGGLAPSNVGAAVALGPYAVDVASGVEAVPGIKDAAKLRSFVLNAKSAR